MLTDICSNDAQNSSVLSLNGVELSNNQTLNIILNNNEGTYFIIFNTKTC